MENSKKKKKEEKEVVERQHCNTWGYRNPDEVVQDILGGIHESLLRGYYVFAYRSNEGEIKRLIVSRTGQDEGMYGMVTSGWTCIFPSVTRDGLLSLVVPDLVSKKVNKDIIEDFKYYILQ